MTLAPAGQSRLRFLARSGLRFHPFLKANDVLIGSSGLQRIDWGARRFEVGYWGRTGYRGYGYVTEAVDGLTRYARERLEANRIVIRSDARNHGSRRDVANLAPGQVVTAAPWP